MDNKGRLDGDVIGIRHLRGSASEVTTAASITAYLGRCDACRRPVRADVSEDKGSQTTISCPDCGAEFPADRLVVVTTDKMCASECRIAYGSDCTCACSGVNHARVWGMRLKAEELTEPQVIEQLQALLRYRRNQLAVLERLAKKQEENASMRATKFEEWLEKEDHEIFVSDLFECKDPRVSAIQTQVENNEIPSALDERKARAVIAELKASKSDSSPF